jgi:hypothetical protein
VARVLSGGGEETVMKRRVLLGAMIALAVGGMGLLAIDESIIRRVWYKFESLFKRPSKLPPDKMKTEAVLSDRGQSVSVEMALNSRCNSDNDNNTIKFHWGMFDANKKLSAGQIKRIIESARIPRFTDRRVEIRNEGNVLSFISDNRCSGLLRDWLMVENGMLQQTVALVCAALGVGMVFRGYEQDGTVLSEEDILTVKARLDPMKPSYEGSFWSGDKPSGAKEWVSGNLPDPERNGGKALLASLSEVETGNKKGMKATGKSLGQLLWAARGRSPHYYKSKPWGMTIPTWKGEQDSCSVYLICGGEVWRYVNWEGSRPTHALRPLSSKTAAVQVFDDKVIPPDGCFIVLGRNEITGKALWEVGYQLINLLLQANGLGIAYESLLVDTEQKERMERAGIVGPAAIVKI